MRRIIRLTVIFALVAYAAGRGNPLNTAGDSLRPAGYFDDGPHVVWQNDSTATVLYFCSGEVNRRPLTVADSVVFRGFCGDSSTSYTIFVGAITPLPHIHTGVSKIFAISDIHGEYEYFVDILKNTGVIDAGGDWSWGIGHLVIVGDVFDRGDRVTECLWLIRRLESQARKAGGGVHFVLGNHELMVMRGDNRYVNEKYLEGICKKTRIRHEDLYGPDTELGRWLRTKNTVVKLNDMIFVHGGIGSFVAGEGWTPDAINDLVRRKIDLRSSQLAFDDTARFLFGSRGPFWYRGYHYGMEGRYEKACSTSVDSVLSRYDAATIVIGHTECAEIHRIFGARIIAIDVPVEDLLQFHGLLWQDNRFFKVMGDGQLVPIE
ncbi:MAG: metallophosphoesterase [Candidatus Zixiibacteriota bacterium]|nr:MAG: metallophosphoesterase [candidate division Zixibacteria bacterium]